MKRLLLPVGAALTLVLAGSASALLTPGRTVTAPATVGAVSVTNRAVAYAVGRTRENCGSVVLCDGGTEALLRPDDWPVTWELPG